MKHFINTSSLARDLELHTFYAYAVLPQFGIQNTDVYWEAAEALHGDESLHRFKTNSDSYVLVFEDYDGLGRSKAFIKGELHLDEHEFEFVPPVSSTNSSPSYDGFRLPAPARYCANITGTYTLIRLKSK